MHRSAKRPTVSRRDVVRSAIGTPLALILAACLPTDDDETSGEPDLVIAARETLTAREMQREPTPTPGPSATAASTPTVAPSSTETPAPTPAPADPEVLAGLRELVIPFDTVQPESGLDDLEPLRELIGDARVVALGEATHGTSEFFTMKHRLVEFLVQELGFTAFGMELTWAGSRLVDAYVQAENDDQQQVHTGLSIWPWQTQEVMAMVDWMRDYNVRAETPQPFQFFGFDAFSSVLTIEQVLAYVEQVDPAALERFSAYYAAFDTGFSTASNGLEQAQTAFDDLSGQREPYVAASSTQAFETALHNARTVTQMQQIIGTENGGEVRDQHMAANVEWILTQLEPDAKIILWAHNGHVAAPPYELEFRGDSYKRMGSYLRETYGDRYVAVGFDFHAGEFRAFAGTFETPQLPADAYELTYRQLELPLFILDLRALQPGAPVTDWLEEPHPRWNIGASYDGSSPEEAWSTYSIPDLFDLLIYIQDSSLPTPL